MISKCSTQNGSLFFQLERILLYNLTFLRSMVHCGALFTLRSMDLSMDVVCVSIWPMGTERGEERGEEAMCGEKKVREKY